MSRRKTHYIHIAERALSKSLPEGAIVHHADGNRTNNANNNLVICQDAKYHGLLHQRTRALRACGDPNKRSCRYCKEFDEQQYLQRHMGQNHDGFYHKRCQKAYALGRKSKTARFERDYRQLQKSYREIAEQARSFAEGGIYA